MLYFSSTVRWSGLLNPESLDEPHDNLLKCYLNDRLVFRSNLFGFYFEVMYFAKVVLGIVISNYPGLMITRYELMLDTSQSARQENQ